MIRRFPLDCQIDPPGDTSGGGTPSAETPTPASTPAPSGSDDVDYGDQSVPMPSEAEINDVRNLLETKSKPEATLTTDEMRKLLGFNVPLGPAPKPAPTKVEPKPAPAKPAEAAAPKPPEAPKPSPDTQAIIDAIKAQQTPAPTPATSTPAPAADEAPKPYYGEKGYKPAIQIPEQIVQAIFDAETPGRAAQGLNALIQGLANHIMADVAADQMNFGRFVLGQIPSILQSHQVARDTSTEFYTRYPELNRKPLHGITKILSDQLVARNQKEQKPVYDEAFYKELGEGLHRYVESELGVALPRKGQPAAPAFAPAPVPAAAAVPSPKPNGKSGEPWMTPGGSRPPAGPEGKGKSAEIFDFLF